MTVKTQIRVSWGRSKRSHLPVAGVTTGDLRNGGFPLLCGRWAPEGFDAEIELSSRPLCRKCAAVEQAAIAGRLEL